MVPLYQFDKAFEIVKSQTPSDVNVTPILKYFRKQNYIIGLHFIHASNVEINVVEMFEDEVNFNQKTKKLISLEFFFKKSVQKS